MKPLTLPQCNMRHPSRVFFIATFAQSLAFPIDSRMPQWPSSLDNLDISISNPLTRRAGFPAGPAFVNTTDLCNSKQDSTFWSDNQMPAFVDAASVSLQPFTTGILDTFVNAIPKLANPGFDCTFENGCPLDDTAFQTICPDNPVVFEGIFAMKNFASFYNQLGKIISDEMSVMQGRAKELSGKFSPAADLVTSTGTQNSGGKDLGFALSVVGTLAAVATPLVPVAALVSVAGAAVSFIAGLDATTLKEPAEINNFGDISTTFSQFSGSLTAGLTNFVDSNLHTTPEGSGYENDPTAIPRMLFNGGFASIPKNGDGFPVDNINIAVDQTLASLAINNLWQKGQVVLAVFKKEDFSSGHDPCDPNNKDFFFNSRVKFCDSDGNAHVLQTIPKNLNQLNQDVHNVQDPAKYLVPGFDKLGDFHLSIQDMVVSAKNTQSVTGKYNSPGPAPADFAKTIAAIDPMKVQVSDTIFSNLPTCIFATGSAPALSDAAKAGCANPDFHLDQDLCEFYTHLLVNCPQQVVGGDKWPYQTQEQIGAGFQAVISPAPAAPTPNPQNPAAQNG